MCVKQTPKMDELSYGLAPADAKTTRSYFLGPTSTEVCYFVGINFV